MKHLTPNNLTDHFTSHRAVIGLYERLLFPLIESTHSILEIGTNTGGGIQMYAELFPKAEHCFAVDILPKPDGLNDARIQFIQGNAYTEGVVKALKHYGGEFSLIVDDGPHTVGSQIEFCRKYPPLLSAEGIAIIEDIQKLEDCANFKLVVPQGFASAIVDLRHVNGRYDDLLFLIWRDGSNPATKP